MNEPNTSNAPGVFSPKSASLSAAQASVEADKMTDMILRNWQNWVPRDLRNYLTASLLRVAQQAVSSDKGSTPVATVPIPMELLEIVKAAYLKHHVGLDNVGWDALGDMMQNALCNAMGDVGFQRWLEENTR